MAIAHLTIDLRLRNEGCDRVDDQDIDRAGAHHRLGDLQCLLTGIRLGNIEIIDINADVLRVLRIQCMLCIDEAGDPATLLYFGHGMERERRLTRGLRSIDFDDSSLRVAAGTERDIQGKGSGRYGFDI